MSWAHRNCEARIPSWQSNDLTSMTGQFRLQIVPIPIIFGLILHVPIHIGTVFIFKPALYGFLDGIL